MDLRRLQNEGYLLLKNAVDETSVRKLLRACEAAFEIDHQGVRAKSNQGHIYAARNLIEHAPIVRTFWQTGTVRECLNLLLGEELGLVRVLYFDKPPDRSWSLPWHKDTAIAVRDNTGSSALFTRPTTKAGVPHVIAPDEVLYSMLTLRVHLDDVTPHNGPLRVVPGSHVSSTAVGVGVERAETIYAAAGDILAMRPLISHSSIASEPTVATHRRVLHLEFTTQRDLPDGFAWHDFVAAN